MDVAIKDAMEDLAEKRMNEMRVQQQRQQRAPSSARVRDGSSLPPLPSSDIDYDGTNGAPQVLADIPDLVREVQSRIYRARPFGLDNTINLRELNPGDMDKLVSVKGLVIRTTPVIPDMKDAFFRCS
ncbi:MCM DNA helicase complex subunit, partial [Cryomyces antarcticus]